MEEDPYCNNCQRHISAANFAVHSAFCERNVKVCKICNEPIQVSEEKEHLEEFHITVPCDLCGILLEKWMLPKHQELCTKRLVTCKYCEGDVSFEEFPDHFEFCSSRTEKCTLCKKYIMLRDKEKHSEIHLCERKIRHANIDKETKQNIINEVISNSTSPEQDIEKKVIATTIFSSATVVNKNGMFPQSIVSNERSTSDPNKSKEVDEARNSSNIPDDILTNEGDTHLKSRVPTGACAVDLPNEISKRYGTCYICNQTIPWIDMNTHIPSCASDAGKCSRCGEDVPNHEIKEHVSKNCKVLLREGSPANKTDLKREKISKDGTFYVEKDINDQDMQQCLYCKQACSLDRIVEHMKSCTERFYECPYCNLKIPKNDKGRHELFECSVLLEIQGHDPLYVHSRSDLARNSPEKYKYTTNINMTSQSKAMKEKSSIDKSYADASRKFSSHDKNGSKCKSCCPCHKKSSCKNQEHSYTCQKSLKGSCFYCFEEIDSLKEDIHLSTCKRFLESDKSKPENQTSHKGAIPKRSNFADMVKPQKLNCKFCKNSFNVDVFSYHEKECIDQPFTCEECDDSFPLKDLEDHKCKVKRGRGKRGKQEVQVKTGSGFGFGRIRDFFSKSENNGENDSDRFHSTYSSDTFDVKIPCEFCEKLFPASEIVVHQTGCAPDLVCLPRKNSSEKVESKTRQTNIQEDSMLQKRFFPSETKTDLLYSRSEGRKKYIDSNVKPGEFLESSYGDIETSETSKAQNVRSLVYPPNSPIHSVWNISSSDIKARDSKILSHTSILDKEKESETSSDAQKQFEDEEIFNSDDEMTEMLDFINDSETNTADKETLHSKYEELHRKYSKENASHVTSDHNLNSQGLHEDVPEIKKFLQLAEPTSSLEKKPTKFERDTDFDVKRLKHHHLPNIASENRAFMIEPVEKHCLEHTSARKIGEGVKHSARDNRDVKLQHTSPESESDASLEVDLEKWTKWRSRESSNNS